MPALELLSAVEAQKRAEELELKDRYLSNEVHASIMYYYSKPHADTTLAIKASSRCATKKVNKRVGRTKGGTHSIHVVQVALVAPK